MIHKPNKQYYSHADSIVNESGREIRAGLKILNSVKKDLITVFGSHSIQKNNKYYIQCEQMSYELGKKGYGIITGGGPGIMEAANSGAKRAGTVSIGFKAKLLQLEQDVNSNIFTHQFSYKFLFARRFCLAIESEALIFYPGGYGTLNELFEYITLIQTKMVDLVPIMCVGKKYWAGMLEWLETDPIKEGALKIQDLKIISLVDDLDEIIKIIEG